MSREYSTKKSNAIISATTNNANLTRDQLIASCTQLIEEKIKTGIGQDIQELARLSRQAAIINLLAAFLVLLSVVVVFFS